MPTRAKTYCPVFGHVKESRQNVNIILSCMLTTYYLNIFLSMLIEVKQLDQLALMVSKANSQRLCEQKRLLYSTGGRFKPYQLICTAYVLKGKHLTESHNVHLQFSLQLQLQLSQQLYLYFYTLYYCICAFWLGIATFTLAPLRYPSPKT